MKKVYSLILLLCSFSMAGFAIPAKQVICNLPTDSSPGTSGSGTVVSSSTITNGVTRSIAPFSALKSSYSYTIAPIAVCSNGWLALNNRRSETANNVKGVVPGAGFLMALWKAPDGVPDMTKYFISDRNSYRVFALNGFMPAAARGLGNVCNHASLYNQSNTTHII